MQAILEVLGTVQVIGGILFSVYSIIMNGNWFESLIFLVLCLVLGSLLVCIARIVDLLEMQNNYLSNIQKHFKNLSIHIPADNNLMDL